MADWEISFTSLLILVMMMPSWASSQAFFIREIHNQLQCLFIAKTTRSCMFSALAPGFLEVVNSRNRSWAYTGENFISASASKICPLHKSTTTCKGTVHGLPPNWIYIQIYNKKTYNSKFQKIWVKNSLNTYYTEKHFKTWFLYNIIIWIQIY